MSAAAPGLTSLLLLFAGGPAACLAQEDPAEELARRELAGSVRSEDLWSRARGRRVPYSLYLPPGYRMDTTRRHPVLVLLHGLFENEERWLRRGGPQIVEEQIQTGSIPPVVVVAPDGGDGLWVDGPGRRDGFRTFLADELLPHIGSEWRVRTDREGRWLVGLSAGGYGALGLAFTRPRLFGAVAVFDPMLLAPKPSELPERHRELVDHPLLRRTFRRAFGDPLREARWTRNHPETLVRDLSPDDAPRIRIETFTDDPFGFRDGAAGLHHRLEEAGIPHAFHVRPGRPGWQALREYLPPCLRFLGGTDDIPSGTTSRPAKAGRDP